MEINGKVYLMFEQSGVFKNEFKKLGYEAFDYDIQDNFGETDYVKDLFAEIENAYSGGGESIFDNITKDDLIMAFFPCIYFTGSTNPCYYTLENINYQKMTTAQKIDAMLQRSKSRQQFYELIITSKFLSYISIHLLLMSSWVFWYLSSLSIFTNVSLFFNLY